jgi:hypothetical protein
VEPNATGNREVHTVALFMLVYSVVEVFTTHAETADGAATFTAPFSQSKRYEDKKFILFAVKKLDSSESDFCIRVYKRGQRIFDGKSNTFMCPNEE